jgi:hypothetical protein
VVGEVEYYQAAVIRALLASMCRPTKSGHSWITLVSEFHSRAFYDDKRQWDDSAPVNL